MGSGFFYFKSACPEQVKGRRQEIPLRERGMDGGAK